MSKSVAKVKVGRCRLRLRYTWALFKMWMYVGSCQSSCHTRTRRSRMRYGWITQRGVSVSRTYINCIGDKPHGGAKSPQAEEMDYYELSSGHDAMVTSPKELADLLITVV
jgi:hypothetical protein